MARESCVDPSNGRQIGPRGPDLTKALAHILLVVRGRQYWEDRVEQTVIDAAADGIGWRNRRAGLVIRWEEALLRGRLVWRPPSWGVRSTWRPSHGEFKFAP